MRRVPRVIRPRERSSNISKYSASRALHGFNKLQEANSHANDSDMVTNGALMQTEVRICEEIARLRSELSELIAITYDEDGVSRQMSFGTRRSDGSKESVAMITSRTTSKAFSREASPNAKSATVAACLDKEEEQAFGADNEGEEEKLEIDDETVHTGTLSHHHCFYRWPQSLQLRPRFSLEGEIEEANQKALRDGVELIKEKGTNLNLQGLGGSNSLFDYMWPQASTLSSVKEVVTIAPDSLFRLSYDVTSMWVLAFELVYMPYSLTWSIDYAISHVLLVITTCFWIFDMCLSFLTGYNTSDGLVEMDNARIAARYLKTWFPVDLLCVTGDILNLFFAMISVSVSSTDGWASFLRVAKLARFLRLLSVVRSIRIVNAYNHYLESRLSEAWRMLVKILEIAFLLIWIGHLVACFWFQIGRYGPITSTGEVWIDNPLGIGGVPLREHNRFYQYVTSYHWGLAQITLGAHDINPVSPWERLFVICINLFGLLFGGTLVSVLSTTLIDLKEMNQEKTRTLRDLKSFLLQNDVVVGIRMRCFSQVNERLSQREAILVEKDVAALDLLSVGLCRELRHDLYSKYLLKHPLLITWNSVSDQTVMELCSDPQGLEFVLLLTDDELFTPGTPARGAYCLLEGSITYGLDKRTFHSWMTDIAQMADPGQWISEAAWWCQWIHVGTAQTAHHVPCKLLCLTPENLSRVMLQSRSVEAITKLYANAFYQCTIKASADTLPTDLKVYYTGFGDLLFAMPSDAQVLVGHAAVRSVWEALRSSRVASMSWGGSNLIAQGLQLLMDEVWNGKATVVMDGRKSLQRHVSLVVLALKHGENVLVELADYNPGDNSTTQERISEGLLRGPQWKCSCRLPGVKQLYGELPHEAVHRLIANRLAQLQPALATKGPEEVALTAEIEPSQTFGVDTKYSKARCVLQCGPDELALLDTASVIVDNVMTPAKLKKSFEIQGSRRTLTQIENAESQCFHRKIPNTLYVLSGTAHVGVYAWMTLEDLKEVSADSQLKENVLHQIQTQVPLPGESTGDRRKSSMAEADLDLLDV